MVKDAEGGSRTNRSAWPFPGLPEAPAPVLPAAEAGAAAGRAVALIGVRASALMAVRPLPVGAALVPLDTNRRAMQAFRMTCVCGPAQIEDE
jgi:hypothetical protein